MDTNGDDNNKSKIWLTHFILILEGKKRTRHQNKEKETQGLRKLLSCLKKSQEKMQFANWVLTIIIYDADIKFVENDIYPNIY